MLDLHKRASRGPAWQVGKANDTNTASGVAYAETCGANALLSWTEVGPKNSGHSMKWKELAVNRMLLASTSILP
jgi:hypothetical protein